jgi:hypothetical protein
MEILTFFARTVSNSEVLSFKVISHLDTMPNLIYYLVAKGSINSYRKVEWRERKC